MSEHRTLRSVWCAHGVSAVAQHEHAVEAVENLLIAQRRPPVPQAVGVKSTRTPTRPTQMAADRWKAGGCACLPACESPFSDSPRSQQRRNVEGSSDAIRALIGIKCSSARRKEAKGRDDRKPAGAKRSRTCRKHNACARRRRPVRLTRNTLGPCARACGDSPSPAAPYWDLNRDNASGGAMRRRGDLGRWPAALHSQSSSASPDHNDPFHAGLIMTRQQAGELERSRLGETPQQLLAVGS